MALPITWVNHPARAADAAYRPVQMPSASARGLSGPDTVITNSADAVHRFATDHDAVVTNWRERARALADQLTAAGQLHDPALAAAVTAVPRHALVPHFYQQTPERSWTRVDAADPTYDATVYANTTLVTALADLGAGFAEPVSSSSQPSLMIRMLEIGTGTGYNAALLSHRLGAANVFSVDVDAGLVAAAADRLAAIGYRPTLAVADGAAGLPDHAPYDAIIATCSVPAVPPAWIEQVTDGGAVLADVKVQNAAGNLVLLRRHGPRTTGRFAARYAAFMPLRHTADAITPNAAADGSTSHVTIGGDHHQHQVSETGPIRLWAHVEDAHQQWAEWGQPGWDRLGLTVDTITDSQVIWLDEQDNPIATLSR